MTVLAAEYRHQAQAQFQVLLEQVKTCDNKIEAMEAGIRPVLDCIGLEQPEGPRLLGDGPYRSIAAGRRARTSKRSCAVPPMEPSSTPLRSCGHTTHRWTSNEWQLGMPRAQVRKKSPDLKTMRRSRRGDWPKMSNCSSRVGAVLHRLGNT